MIAILAAAAIASCGPVVSNSGTIGHLEVEGNTCDVSAPDPRAYRHDHKECQMHTIDKHDFRPTWAGAAFGPLGQLAGGGIADKTARWEARIQACMEAKGYPVEVPR